MSICSLDSLVVTLTSALVSHFNPIALRKAKFLSAIGLKFYVKVFYVMGKALKGELSCRRTGFV